MGASEEPGSDGHEQRAGDEADERAEDDEENDATPFAGEDKHAKARLGDGRAGDAGDQGVGRAGGQSQEPGDDVPDDGADEAAHDDVDIDDGRVDEIFGD